MNKQKRVIGAAGGALGLGGLAAVLGLCCTVPWAVTLLGVTGAVAFARLAFLIPYALLGSLTLLAAGFWFAYRRPATCPDDDCIPASQRRIRWLVWAAAALVAALSIVALPAASGFTDAGSAPSAPAYAVLDEAGTQLRADFNRARGSVRLLFVVDPVCAVCLRGLDDLNRALLARTQDPRLQTFVVHVPVIGAEAKDIPPASALLRNSHVHHYWNPSGEFGRQLAKAAGLRHGDELVYAWDVWLIYGPDADWNGALPPQPQRLMHQLPSLRDSAAFPRLDAEAFATEVNRLLARLPPRSNQP